MPQEFDWPMYDSPLFDRGRIADHAEYLPPGQVSQLLAAFERELKSKPALIAQLVSARDEGAARAAAHQFKGAAMSVGGARVAWLADAIESAALTAMPPLADALVGCARATLAEVQVVAQELEDGAAAA